MQTIAGRLGDPHTKSYDEAKVKYPQAEELATHADHRLGDDEDSDTVDAEEIESPHYADNHDNAVKSMRYNPRFVP